MIKISKEFFGKVDALSYRQSPKERMSQDLGTLFKEMLRKTGRDIKTLSEALSGHEKVTVDQLRMIELGKAYMLSRSILIRVFEFLPIDDSEGKNEASRLIRAICVPFSERRGVHFYSQR